MRAFVLMALLLLGAVLADNKPGNTGPNYEFDEDTHDTHDASHDGGVLTGHTGFIIADVHTTPNSEFFMSAVGAMIVATASRLVLEIFEIHILPESAIIIIIGFLLGLLIWAGGSVDLFEFDNNIFFLLLIPPIIFESGYHMDRPSFFANVALILWYALVGTAVVAALVGLILWGAAGLYGFRTDLVQTLTFGSLIAAVDPVAVISIFNEMQVNENLHILVFGESVLNDAVSIVLYNVFLALDGIHFTWQIPFLAFLKFLYVSIGGLLFGIVTGLFTCFFLRFFKPTYHVHVVETLVIALMGWMSFMAAESFLMSGIVSCMFAGITINRYAEGNLHPNSVTTTNYVLSILAGTTETMIFLFLGIQSLVTPLGLGKVHTSVTKIWDTGAFLGLTILLIVPFRFMLTYAMGYMENTRRIEKITDEDFFIISYGGLRGAIAFALAWDLPRTWPGRIVMVNTVIVCIWFTVFIQGGTIGPIIRFLRVKRRDNRDPNIAERVIPRVYPHLQMCMRRIYGVNRSLISRWMEKTDIFLESIIHREFDPEAALKEALEAQESGDKGVKEMKKIDEMNLNDFYRATSKFQGPAGMAPDMDAFSRRTMRATAGRATFRATSSQPRQTSRHTRFRDDADLAPRRGTTLFKEQL